MWGHPKPPSGYTRSNEPWHLVNILLLRIAPTLHDLAGTTWRVIRPIESADGRTGDEIGGKSTTLSVGARSPFLIYPFPTPRENATA